MTAWLPKTCSTSSVVVLDVAREAENPGALFALATLQGIVNRTQARKVFLNYPLRDPSHPGVMPLEAWFEDGLIPFPVVRPGLDGTKRFPALAWLLAEHAGLLRGAILSPPRLRAHEGGIAAATTACGFEDAIALTPDLAAHLRGEGWNLPARASTVGLDNLASLRWLLGRYAHDPRRGRRLMGFTHGGRPTYMVDYWVATRSLCFYLDARLPHEAAAFAEILKPAIVPPGTIVYGDVEGTDARHVTQQLGYTVAAGDLCNLSVTASIPSDPARIRRPPAPRSWPLDPAAAYVSWNGFDGDCPIGVGAFGYLALREAAKDANAPFGMWFHPHMLDLFPTMAQWWSERGTGQLDVVASLNDGGVAPWTEEGRAGWRDGYRALMARANGLFQVFNVFYETEDIVHAALGGPLRWPFAILGYNPEHYFRDEGPTRWKRLDDTVYCNQGCRGGGMDGAAAIRAAVAATPAGTPAFVMAKLWGPHGRFLESASEAMRHLRAHPPDGRRLVFLPPRDIAATWRAWAEIARPRPPASIWPGPAGERFRPQPLRPDAVTVAPRPMPDMRDCAWVVLPADVDAATIAERVRATPAGNRAACWQVGERADAHSAHALTYAERLAVLRRQLGGRASDRVVLRVNPSPDFDATLSRYRLFQAIEVAAAGAVDAVVVDTSASVDTIRPQLRQFHSLRSLPVLVVQSPSSTP